jgi:hypothetical protein
MKNETKNQNIGTNAGRIYFPEYAFLSILRLLFN